MSGSADSVRVLVLGAAASGMAAARLARRRGARPVIYDRDRAATGRILAGGFAPVTGEWDRSLLDGVELVVTSPGFEERSAPIVDTLESGLPLVSEIEYAWWGIEAPVVGITGTNGKTTVTELVSQMLTASGRRAPALGNIGSPLSDAVGSDLDVAVVECSSFQLRFIDRFRPRVAVVTNVAPDHLDWHRTFDAYLAAKARLVENQTSEDLFLYSADDEGATRIARLAPSRTRPASVAALPEGGVGVEDGHLVWDGLRLPLQQVATSDPAYLTDLVLAGAAALEMGATREAVATVAGRFRPGAHRRQLVHAEAGVAWVDDSKATNPHAALAALDAYPSVVLIAGGVAKGLDVTPLARHPHVRALIALGEAAPALLEAAGERGTPAGSMEEAVETAQRLARPGDTVLLAPGCASFDMFESYIARGDAFREAVTTIMAPEVRRG